MQFFDDAGDPLADGWLKFLVSETTSTLKDTYSDSDLLIANSNPVQLDSAGRCPDVFGSGSYRVVSYEYNSVTGLLGSQIQLFDPVTGADSTTLGTAAERDAEDTLTYGSDLPDGAAVADYVIGLTYYGILSTSDDKWQGLLTSAVAGETLTGYQWAPLYCKDTGSGTRFYLYDCDAVDADSYSPVALLKSSGTIVAGDSITITVGDGILSKDGWTTTTPAAGHVGKAVYCTDTKGVVDFTMPSAGHIKQIGTLFNIAANGRDIFDVSFRYLEGKI